MRFFNIVFGSFVMAAALIHAVRDPVIHVHRHLLIIPQLQSPVAAPDLAVVREENAVVCNTVQFRHKLVTQHFSFLQRVPSFFVCTCDFPE